MRGTRLKVPLSPYEYKKMQKTDRPNALPGRLAAGSGNSGSRSSNQ